MVIGWGLNYRGKIMFFPRFNKKGEAGIEDFAKWLLYIGILIAAGFAIVKVIGSFG